MAALLTDTSQNLAFSDLSGSSVGETIGSGLNATIILDDNASGHNRYIAPTLRSISGNRGQTTITSVD